MADSPLIDVDRGEAWHGVRQLQLKGAGMHFPGHMREAFGRWVDASQPTTATVEVNCVEEQWPARRLLGRISHCSDIMPAGLCAALDMSPGRTYAAASLQLLRELKREIAA